jgi:hypothetical protein
MRLPSALALSAALAAVTAAAPARAQQALPAADWSAFAPLLGEWEADAAAPDGSTGGFTLAPDLGGRVLLRRNFALYPKTKDREAFRHDDLTVFHVEGGAVRADYWDNEGHLIHYAVAVTKAGKDEKGPTVVCTSDAVKGAPRFRFTYAVTGPTTMSIQFEIAGPGKPDEFRPYITAGVHKKG